MHDRTTAISLTKLLAVSFGAIGLLLVLVNFWLPTDKVAFLGCPLVCVSAVLWVRRFLCEMSERERNAFQLGRDSATLRTLR